MTLGTGSGANLDTNGYTVTLAGSLSGPGSLTKVDSGTLILTGTNTYTGTTTVKQGELLVNGSLVSPVTVNSGILGGTGTLSTVTISPSGTIAPGSPLGTLTLSGSLILSSGAMLDYDLDTPTTSGMIECASLAVGSPLGFSNFSFENTSNFRPGVYDLIQSRYSRSLAFAGRQHQRLGRRVAGEPVRLGQRPGAHRRARAFDAGAAGRCPRPCRLCPATAESETRVAYGLQST